jgi:hypothetical protein
LIRQWDTSKRTQFLKVLKYNIFLYKYVHLNTTFFYIYIYICVCVCVHLNTTFLYINIYIIDKACSRLLNTQSEKHSQTKSWRYQSLPQQHTKKIEILKEELARIWQSNLQAFQYWGPPETRTIMAEFWVRPPFHNGELPRLLYIKRGSPYMLHLFSYNTIFVRKYIILQQTLILSCPLNFAFVLLSP